MNIERMLKLCEPATYANMEDGVKAEISWSSHYRKWSVRVVDLDTGGVVGVMMFPGREQASDYALKAVNNV